MANSRLLTDADFERLNKFKWHLSSHGYAKRSVWKMNADGKRTVSCAYIHHEIIKCPSGLERDHIDGNRLNN